MRRSIPSRVCDRCGEPYELYAKGPRKAHALRVHLEGKEPRGFPDMCPKCSTRIDAVLDTLVFGREFDGITAEDIATVLRHGD